MLFQICMTFCSGLQKEMFPALTVCFHCKENMQPFVSHRKKVSKKHKG